MVIALPGHQPGFVLASEWRKRRGCGSHHRCRSNVAWRQRRKAEQVARGGMRGECDGQDSTSECGTVPHISAAMSHIGAVTGPGTVVLDEHEQSRSWQGWSLRR